LSLHTDLVTNAEVTMPNLIPLTTVPALIESWYGWRPHSMTVFRWTQGVRGGQHKLKTIKRGSRRLTSRSELRRFMRAWSGDERDLATPRQSKSVDERELERATARLKKMGML
jgi:hypothetical protein